MTQKNVNYWWAFAVPVVAVIAMALFVSSVNAQAVSFTTQLDVGDTGSEVTKLQTYLANDSTLYPERLVTGYYGNLTAQAVSRFQTRHGLPAVGRVGPMTLAKLNELSGTGGSDDLSAPIIFNVNTSTSGGTTTISWNTNELSIGRVYYGTMPLTTLDASSTFTAPWVSGSVVAETGYGTSHSLTIPNVLATTTYYYTIQSTDVAGNVMLIWPRTFVTP